MRLLLLSSILIPFLLEARENPFTPVEITKIYETPKAAVIESKAVESVPAAAFKKPEKIAAAAPKPDVPSKQETANYAKVRFVFKENSAYIETKDKVIKHFAISNPSRIVIDFESPSDFASKRKELTTRPFKKLEIGAHSGSYRVVLSLDGSHKYKIEQSKDGQIVTITD